MPDRERERAMGKTTLLSACAVPHTEADSEGTGLVCAVPTRSGCDRTHTLADGTCATLPLWPAVSARSVATGAGGWHLLAQGQVEDMLEHACRLCHTRQHQH